MVFKEDTMVERRLQVCPNKMGPSSTGPLPLSIHQWYTQFPVVKCVWVQACPCRADNPACTDGCTLGKCRNKVYTCTIPYGWEGGRYPTGPRLTTNVNQNITETTKASPIICQVVPQVFFHPEYPVLLPSVLTDGVGWPDLLYRSSAAHAAHALTETAASNTATPAAIGVIKINSKCAWQTEVPSVTPRLPANLDGYFTSAASSGESYGD